MTKKTKTWDIDQIAQSLMSRELVGFRFAEPRSGHDFGIDYYLEGFRDDGAIDGLHIGVQLKGKRRPKYTACGLFVIFPVKTSHLEYFLDRCTLPMMLIGYDVSSNRGFWLSLQQYLHSLPDQLWRKQKSKQVRVPVENELSDQARFCRARIEAVDFMRELRPGSPAAAVQGLERHLRLTEPRADFSVTQAGRDTHIVVTPRESMSIELELLGTQESKARVLNDLVNAGKSIAFSDYGVEAVLRGSPIVEGKSPASVHFYREQVASLNLNSDTSSRTGVSITGRIRSGATQAEFQSSSDLKELSIAMELASTSPGADIDFRVNLERWDGADLRMVPNFDLLKRLFLPIPDSLSCELELMCLGNSVIKSRLTFESDSELALLGRLIGYLSKARDVARVLNKSIVWNGELSRADVHAIDVLYALSRGEPVELQYSRLQTETQVPAGEAEDLLRRYQGHRSFEMLQSSHRIELFGEQIDVGPVVIEWSDSTVDKAVVSPADSNGMCRVELGFVPNANPFLSMRTLTPSPPRGNPPSSGSGG